MGILGLTGKAQLPRIGSLRKGEPKPDEKHIGRDLGEDLRFIGADDEITADWVATFGDIKVNEIIVRLPFATVDENWEAWREAYSAGGMLHRCDGRTTVQVQLPDGTYDFAPRPCPGDCKPVGRLSVFVPAFQRLGTITVNTTSIHDIMNLDGCLRSLAMLVGDLTRVPFMLKRVRREISTPGGPGGKRARRGVWLLHLEPSPEWVRAITAGGQALAELAGPEVLALPAPSPAQLPEHQVVVTTPTGEIIDGDASKVQNGFRARIEACTTLEELRALWPDIVAIEEAAYKANVIALWRVQAVVIMRAMIPGSDVETRGALAQRLEQLPDTTPGRDEALREIEDINWADSIQAGQRQRQAAMLAESVPA